MAYSKNRNNYGSENLGNRKGQYNQGSYGQGYNKAKGSAGNGKEQCRDRQASGGYRYTGAPYNFVRIWNKVYGYPKDKLTGHDEMSEELLTGEIVYEIEAKSPIIIDDGNGCFVKDAKGRYAIPGSTVRGLIRSNVQILGLSCYEDDIDDYALMYRNVAYGSEKKRYNTVLGAKQIRIDDGGKSYGIGVLLNVRAGYVENRGGKYTIYQTCVDSIKKEFKGMNYYVLSERKIVADYLKSEGKFSFQVFRPEGKSILQHEFQSFSKVKHGERVQYKGRENKEYKPYYMPVSYEVKREKDIVAVGEPGEYKYEGYAVSTGKMNQKKAVYIIPQIDKRKEPIEIPERDVRAFRIDINKRESTLARFGGRKHFDLPEEGEIKPIFYIQLDGRLYFGFTPRLRLFYDHTVKEGLHQKGKGDRIDYGKALFGYSTQEGSYKSKLSFSDAVLQGTATVLGEEALILAEPKPSSYLDYLKPKSGEGVTYNADDFELRGVKQYWLHKELAGDSSGKAQMMEKVASRFWPLKQGARFTGKIRFQNLTMDEMGLLLWAVRLNENSWMNVGKAKAYGYGNISLEIKEAKRLDLGKAYSSDSLLDLDPFREVCVDEAIKVYKEEVNRFLGTRTIDELPHIKDFFRMKDSSLIPDNDKTRYMSIDEGEYQSRNTPLPEVSDVVGKTK